MIAARIVHARLIPTFGRVLSLDWNLPLEISEKKFVQLVAVPPKTSR
jgi:hypothetical protein